MHGFQVYSAIGKILRSNAGNISNSEHDDTLTCSRCTIRSQANPCSDLLEMCKVASIVLRLPTSLLTERTARLGGILVIPKLEA